jgi:hypothetical protein
MTEDTFGWYGFELPGRTCRGTYDLYDYETLPPIKINDEFKDVTSFEKLVDFLHLTPQTGYLFKSPTACYFEPERNASPQIFYVDQQGCLLWGLDEQERVVTDNGIIVAKTLPEFLSRIEMENAIWTKVFVYGKQLTPEEENYLIFYSKINGK